jgi:hypothetical protein
VAGSLSQRLLILATAVASSVFGLAACGGSGENSASGTSTSTCTVYEHSGTVYEHGVREVVSVTLTPSDAEKACQEWIQARRKEGESWSMSGQASRDQGMVCIFRSKTGEQAEVDGSGERLGALEICSGLPYAGWTEDTQAEAAHRAHAP